MRWMKFTIHTTTEAVDLISSLLDELGIQGIEIQDNVPLTKEEEQAMFTDIPASLPPDDGTATIHFYVDPDSRLFPLENHGETLHFSTGSSIRDAEMQKEDSTYLYTSAEELAAAIREGMEDLKLFTDVGEGSVTMEYTEDQDWMNQWKSFFKPFSIAEDILVKPVWEELPEDMQDGKIIIHIDPGMAFGTGSHETTRLCVLALRKYLHKDMHLLDAGCGSGILSIAALKLGACTALGLDIDALAVQATMENASLNDIGTDRLQAFHANILEGTNLPAELAAKKYDIVVANILADVIIPLSGIIGKYIKEDGLFISSGILTEKAGEVKTALLKNHFEIVETATMGEWVAFTARPVR